MWFSWERLPPAPKVFRGVLPGRWVVERTFAWLCQSRRFSRDYERLCTTSEALIYARSGAADAPEVGSDLIFRQFLADLLADGPRSLDELADATGTHSPSLARLLRMLAALGVVTEETNGHISLTRLGAPLRAGVQGSLRGLVLGWRGHNGVSETLFGLDCCCASRCSGWAYTWDC
jgi:hypothetical protein